MDDFKIKAREILTRFSHEDSILEDPIWYEHNFGSLSCDINPGEFIFENTIHISDWISNEKDSIFNNILEILNTLCSNIDIILRNKISEKDRIVWIYIVCVNKHTHNISYDNTISL